MDRRFAAARLRRDLIAEADAPQVIRDLSTSAAEAYRAAAGDQPRYAWPLATLACLRATVEGFQFVGLGDSCLYLLPDDALEASIHMAIPDAYEREQAAARQHVERCGGIGANGIANDDPQTLAALRRHRGLQNTADGEVWTLGLVPAVADHLSITLLPAQPATALICSDGIADLVALYGAYDAAGLVRAAQQKGLAALITELRGLERDIDPDGLAYPRFKQSDDATAMLVRLTVG